jgi:hypothetical protein
VKDCYNYAREVAKQFGVNYPDIGEILSDTAWCVRKADSELSADWRWGETRAASGVLLLMGPATDKLHHCGIVVSTTPVFVEHSLRGKVFTHNLNDLIRMGYTHQRYLAYKV